jgi:hypothetical protein
VGLCLTRESFLGGEVSSHLEDGSSVNQDEELSR